MAGERPERGEVAAELGILEQREVLKITGHQVR